MFKYFKNLTPIRIILTIFIATISSTVIGYLFKLFHHTAATSLDLALFMITKQFFPYSLRNLIFSTIISSVFSTNPSILSIFLVYVFKGKNPIIFSLMAVTFIFVANVVVIGPLLGGPIVAKTFLNYSVTDLFYFYLEHLIWGLTFGLMLKYFIGVKEINN